MLAYWFSLYRVVPVKITGRDGADSAPRYHATVTADRGPYRRGERLTLEHREIGARPLRRSRQHIGRVYSRALSPDEIARIPTV